MSEEQHRQALCVTLDEAPPIDTCMTFDESSTEDAYTNENGHVFVDALLTRPGIFEYLASEVKSQWPSCDAVQAFDDSVVLRAYRSPESVSTEKYLESAKYAPVTNSHPPSMLNPGNTKGHPVGCCTENVSLDAGRPRARLVLWDKGVIDARARGKREVSVGAYNDFVWDPGTTEDGEPYDFRIENSRVNHIAIVDKGRAGRAVKILDSATVDRDSVPAPLKKGNTMKVDFNGATYDIDDNAASLLAKERKEHKATVDQLTGEVTALRAHKPTLDQSELDKLVDAEIAKREAESKDAEIREAVKKAGLTVTDDMTMDTVRGMYLGAGLDKKANEKNTNDTGMRITSDAPAPVKTFNRTALKARVYR